MTPEQVQQLREPFPAKLIGKLPRVTCQACSKGQCDKHQKRKCDECDAWITTAHIHLDFVGHAAVTDRLLAVDPAWSWEPVAFADDGAPMVRRTGSDAELWIRLTVAGVTRLGVGTASAASFDLSKQLISDALRNAAMRFGVALDLWSKEGLADPEEARPATASTSVTPDPLIEECRQLAQHLTGDHAAAWRSWKDTHPGWAKSRLADARAELARLTAEQSLGLDPPADEGAPAGTRKRAAHATRNGTKETTE